MRRSSGVSVLKALRQEIGVSSSPPGCDIFSNVEPEFVDFSLYLFLKGRNVMQTRGEVEIELHAFIILVIREYESSATGRMTRCDVKYPCLCPSFPSY